MTVRHYLTDFRELTVQTLGNSTVIKLGNEVLTADRMLQILTPHGETSARLWYHYGYNCLCIDLTVFGITVSIPLAGFEGCRARLYVDEPEPESLPVCPTCGHTLDKPFKGA